MLGNYKAALITRDIKPYIVLVLNKAQPAKLAVSI